MKNVFAFKNNIIPHKIFHTLGHLLWSLSGYIVTVYLKKRKKRAGHLHLKNTEYWVLPYFSTNFNFENPFKNATSYIVKAGIKSGSLRKPTAQNLTFTK